MDVNSLDELLGNSSKDKSDAKAPKTKGKSLIRNPLIKELKPVLYYASAVLVLVVGTKYTLFNEDSEYKFNNLTSGVTTIESNSRSIETSILSISNKEAEIEKIREQVTLRKELLSEANLVRTPLESNHHFTSYFDTLVKKHNINLVSLGIFEETITESAIPVPEQPQDGTQPVIPVNQLDDDLKPLQVEIEGTSKDITNLFKDMYTKRIIYDEDLVFKNYYDGRVNVKFIVKFRKDVVQNETTQSS